MNSLKSTSAMRTDRPKRWAGREPDAIQRATVRGVTWSVSATWRGVHQERGLEEQGGIDPRAASFIVMALWRTDVRGQPVACRLAAKHAGQDQERFSDGVVAVAGLLDGRLAIRRRGGILGVLRWHPWCPLVACERTV